MSARILFVDDDASVQEALAFALGEQGYEVSTADDGPSALRLLDEARFDVVLSDLRMSGMSGLELVRSVAQRPEPPPVIVITAYGSVDAAVAAMREGAADFLEKPVSREALRLTLERALRASRLARENEALRERVRALEESEEELIATSQRMRRVLDLVDRVAASDATVLITGESGTGKELVARRLHARSPRKAGPFIALNCSALPKDLLESELFGHEKGAFTGALRSRRGRFLEADGGTLFLDEIGDMDAALQGKLLRALQERTIDVIGGGSVPVDVRVVAATHRDLPELIAGGAFREDLYFRLHVIPVDLPPLRERPEDIPLIFASAVRKAALHAGRQPPRLDSRLLEALLDRPWPGNVRELENVATRLVLTCSTHVIERTHLLDRDGMGAHSTTDAAPSPSPIEQTAVRALADRIELPRDGVALEALERAVVVAALSACDNNRSRAARFLRVPRHVLLYRVEKYGIRDDEVLACGGHPSAPLLEPAAEPADD